MPVMGLIAREGVLPAPLPWPPFGEAAKEFARDVAKRGVKRIPLIGTVIGIVIPSELGSGDCIGNPACEAWLYSEMAKGASVDSGSGTLDVNGVANNPNPNDDDDDHVGGRIPGTNPDWGVNRLTKELHARGYQFEGPTSSGGGRIYRNPATGEEVRIMPRPNREPYRTESPAKFEGSHYYRYRPDANLPEGPHISIPSK
jgi:hypothetical protein